MLTGANIPIHCIFLKEEQGTIDEVGKIVEKSQELALGFPHTPNIVSSLSPKIKKPPAKQVVF
jgi:hypothetical protein